VCSVAERCWERKSVADQGDGAALHLRLGAFQEAVLTPTRGGLTEIEDSLLPVGRPARRSLLHAGSDPPASARLPFFRRLLQLASATSPRAISEESPSCGGAPRDKTVDYHKVSRLPSASQGQFSLCPAVPRLCIGLGLLQPLPGDLALRSSCTGGAQKTADPDGLRLCTRIGLLSRDCEDLPTSMHLSAIRGRLGRLCCSFGPTES
jgi:hypothetical protein